jgi:hypothetical protein
VAVADGGAAPKLGAIIGTTASEAATAIATTSTTRR